MGKLVLITMIMCNLFANICYSVVVPFLPLEFEDFGLDTSIYGYIFGVYAGAGMISSLAVGKLLTSVGRRIILITGMLLLGLSMVAFGFIHFCPNTLVLTIVCLILRSVEGIAASMIVTTWYSIVAITYRANQLRYLGFLESTWGIGMMIGPLIGSILYDFFGFNITFYILGSVFVIISPFLYWIIPTYVDKQDSMSFSESFNQEENSHLALLGDTQDENQNKEDNVEFDMNVSSNSTNNLNVLKDPSMSSSKNNISNVKLPHKRKPVSYLEIFSGRIFIITSIAAFFSCFEYCYMEAILSLRLEDFNLTPIEIGLFFWIYGVMDAFVSLIITVFSDRFDNRMLIAVGMLLAGGANLLVGPSPFLPNSLILMCFGQFFKGMFANFYCITSMSVLIDDAWERFPKRKNEVTDIASGVFTCMLDIGETIGPIYGSIVYSYVGFRWCADSIAYFLLAYSLLYLFVWKAFDFKKDAEESNSISEKKNKSMKGLNNTVYTESTSMVSKNETLVLEKA